MIAYRSASVPVVIEEEVTGFIVDNEERAIRAQTRHTSAAVARRSVRNGSLFRGNAAGQVGF